MSKQSQPTRWLLAATACTLALAITGCTSDDSEGAGAAHLDDTQTFSWRMVTSWPPNAPGVGTAANELAERIATMSKGRLKIKVYGAGELVPGLEVFDSVSSGSIEMGHTAAFYWRGKVPAAQFFAGVPFGLTATEQNAWLHYGGGLELWHEVYEPFNLIAFPAGNTGVQWAGWFRRELNSADDLKGLIVRIPGLGGEVMTRVGAQQAQLAGNEIYTALQTGTIDAAEWISPFADTSMGFQQIVPYYYYPGWQEIGATLELMINKSAWEKLPADLQAIVEASARVSNGDMLSMFKAYNPLTLDQIVSEYDVQVRPLPDDLLIELRQHSTDAIRELAESDPMAKKVYESWNPFRNRMLKYRRITEDKIAPLRTEE